MNLKCRLELNTLNLRTLKLNPVEMVIEPEYKSPEPKIQVLSKPKNKPEIRDTEELF